MKKTILVVREFDKFSRILSENGFDVVNYEAIKTFPLNDLSEFESKTENLENYDGVILTSPKAAEVFLSKCNQAEKVYRGKIYVLGNRTRRLFEKTNFEIVFSKETNTSEELIKSFSEREFKDKHLLFPRGDKSLRAIPELLKGVAEVDEIIVYRTIENPIEDDLSAAIGGKISRGEISWICFFSPSGVESFIKRFGDLLAINKVKIAAIGRTTAGKVAAENLKADFISPSAKAEDFAAGLVNHINNIE